MKFAFSLLSTVASRWLVLLASALLGAQFSASAAPRLVSATPANGTTDVPVAGFTITFVFDTQMLPNTELGGFPPLTGAVKWSGGVSAEGFEYAWSEDSRTLTATYSDDLPAKTTITWELNPSDVFEPLQLTSMEGDPLPKAQFFGRFTTGEAGNSGDPVPKLDRVDPVDGANGVPLNTQIRFTFSRPMQPIPAPGGVPPFVKGAVSFTGNGLDATRFIYGWEQNDTVLVAAYSGNLPKSTQITWALNPADAAFPLTSAEGEELPSGVYRGTFATADEGGEEPCESDGVPRGWGGYFLSESASYQQTSSADPVPEGDEPFLYSSIVNGPTTGPEVVSASLTFPGGTKVNHESFFGSFTIFGGYTNEAALRAALPVGNYTLRFQQSGQAERSFPITLPNNTVPVPKIQNFDETQAVDATKDFTLRWNAFTGASGPNDFVNLTINSGSQVVFQAPDLCVPRPLPVTATSIVIPANTLVNGTNYQVSLSFDKTLYYSTNAVPNMSGFAGQFRVVNFTLTTGTNAPVAQARFVEYRLLPSGNPELVLTGTAGRTYTIQRAGAIPGGPWQPAGTVTPDGTGRARFEDTGGIGFPRFYRALAQ